MIYIQSLLSQISPILDRVTKYIGSFAFSYCATSMAETTIVNMKNIKTTRARTEFSLFCSKETGRYLNNRNIRVLSEKTMDERITEEVKGKENDNYDMSKSDGKSCLLCGVTFSTLEEQRGHFKLDWHKYNIKQRLLLRDPVKENEFEEMISGELSSISGSDSESDSAEEAVTTANPETISLMTLSLLPNERNVHTENVVDKSNPKVYFVNESGTPMSVYRGVVYGTKEMLTCEDIELRIQNLPQESFWCILMTGGGHFAGAVFSGNDVVVSKTFHRYTVRAKRGTAQGIKDNKQGGHAPRSAGASLRRYNEAALVQDIQNLLELWSEHTDKCSKIFMRVPNSYKGIFFSGKKPPFEKDDLRVRVIPFATRRATFKELQNVHRKLSTVIIEENYFQKRVKNEGVENIKLNNKPCEVNVDKHLEEICKISVDATNTIKQETDSVQDGQNQNEFENSDDSVKSKFKTNKENQKTNTTEKRVKEVIPAIWIELYETVNTGDVEKMTNIVGRLRNQELEHEYSVQSAATNHKTDGDIEFSEAISNQEESNKNQCVKDMLNEIFQSYGNESLLHLASRLGQADIVKILLEDGGNPTIKDAVGRVPYNIAKDKETRNVFRRFMAVYPDKYDYNEARIPSALTAEMEERERQKVAEKKKAQSKARKQRLKEKKAEEKIEEEEKTRKEKEENEKKWFQNLTDREKRAVAAERRLGNICFNCSRSLQGLVPFERLSNKYCSTECVQNHRKIMRETVVK